MRKFYKRKLITTLLICSGMLTACNQAGNNAASTNTPQHAVVNDNVETQKLLRISNKTGSVINSVTIVSKSGQLIHQSSSGLDCVDKQFCILDIGGVVTNNSMLAKFYNDKNQLISIAQLKDNPQKLTYMTVYTNSTIFGINLFKQLVTLENSTPALALAQLNKFFRYSNASNHADVFENLGNYYLQQLKSGHIHSEENFLHDLTVAFAQHKTAHIPLTTPTLLKAPMLGCDPGIGDKVADFIMPFATMGGEITEGVALLGKSIFDTVCTAEQFDFQEAFDQVNEKLDNIQASLDVLGADVAALRNLVIVQNEDNVSVSMQQLYDNEISYNRTYTNLLWDADAKSLSEFASAFGGIDQMDRAVWGPNFFDSTEGVVGSIARQNSNITLMTSPAVLKRLSDLLQSRCADYSKIADNKGNPDDILATTDLCNTQAIHTGYYMAALAQQAKLRMMDIVQVINTSKSTAQFKNNFGTKIKWADVPNIINNNTESRLNSTFDFMKNNVFEPRKDFADMNIKITAESGCFIASQLTKTKVFPSFMKWKDNNYDSIKVGASCNGKSLAARTLLPGGIYHIDARQNKIIMDNARNWEVNENINPFISLNAATLTPAPDNNGTFSNAIFVSGYTNRGVTLRGELDWIRNILKNQGREELADSLSWTTTSNSASIPTTFSTKLFIPFHINFEGYKTLAIWASKDYGVRADRYGSSSKGDDLIVPFNGAEYENGYINVDGYRGFRPHDDVKRRYSGLQVS